MQKVPMPSPKNTNYENLSLPSRGGPFAAYDAAPSPQQELIGDDMPDKVCALLKGQVDDDVLEKIHEILMNHSTMSMDDADKDAEIEKFLRGKLSSDDVDEWKRLRDEQNGGPVPFKGMPEVGGTMSMDSRSGYDAMFPDASRIKLG